MFLVVFFVGGTERFQGYPPGRRHRGQDVDRYEVRTG